ncbi:hypothetical protein MRX96_059758 [Rhipicephalus microplus]
MAMEQLPLSSSGIQSTSSEALQAGLSEPGEEASGGGIEPASPRVHGRTTPTPTLHPIRLPDKWLVPHGKQRKFRGLFSGKNPKQAAKRLEGAVFLGQLDVGETERQSRDGPYQRGLQGERCWHDRV